MIYATDFAAARLNQSQSEGFQFSAAPAVVAPAPTPAPAPVLANHPGRAVYDQFCATCHMPDGSGACRLNPGLTANAVVTGDQRVLVDVILRGPAAALPKNRPKYANMMPRFSMLDDRQVADLVTYLRSTFGNAAPPVTAEQVAAIRARP